MSARACAAALALSAVLAGIAGCRQAPAVEPDRVATLGSEEVRWEEFEGYLERHLGESGASLGSDVLSELFDQFLSERLLVRLAVERGLVAAGVGPRSGLLARHAVDRLLAAAAAGRPAPTRQEIEGYYRAHRAEFERPDRVRLRQILIAERQIAEETLAELRGGADFEKVAARLVAEPEIEAEAGYQGELSRDDVPPAFAEAIFSLAAGEVSELVAAEYGYHLFQVVERLPAEIVPLADVAIDIERRLRQETADRLLEELVEEAGRRYDVSVHHRNLPFNYRGRYLEG